jgi:methionyl-tRNA formyltransferase
MRIVFIGSVEFSLRILQHLVASGAEIVGLCTLKESKCNADHVDLGGFGVQNSIPIFYSDDINSPASVSWIKGNSPDVIFCFGWSKLIKEELLSAAPLGVIGYHPSLLPLNRGRHPIIWALVLGLKKTGSTFFRMDLGADSGEIVSQREILISDEDDARALYEKVVRTALTQITELMFNLADASFKSVKQNSQLSNIWRKRNVADGRIDWRMSAQTIHNLVRGLSAPYVGAHFILDGNEIKVWKTQLVHDVPDNAEPGKVLLQSGGKVIIKCGTGGIALLFTQPELKKILGRYL